MIPVLIILYAIVCILLVKKGRENSSLKKGLKSAVKTIIESNIKGIPPNELED